MSFGPDRLSACRAAPWQHPIDFSRTDCERLFWLFFFPYFPPSINSLVHIGTGLLVSAASSTHIPHPIAFFFRCYVTSRHDETFGGTKTEEEESREREVDVGGQETTAETGRQAESCLAKKHPNPLGNHFPSLGIPTLFLCTRLFQKYSKIAHLLPRSSLSPSSSNRSNQSLLTLLWCCARS